MTKRQENALKTRQKILDAAYKLLNKNEFDDLSIDDITNYCNVAKGTFYTYFKHKEDIIFEICRPFFARIEEQMKQMTNKDIIERLTYYFVEFMKEVQRYGINLARVWIKGVTDPSKAPENYDNKKWQYDFTMLKNILNSAIQNKELKEDTPVELLSYVIISQLYGMMTIWCMSDGEFNPKNRAEKFCELQLKVLLKNYLVQT